MFIKLMHRYLIMVFVYLYISPSKMHEFLTHLDPSSGDEEPRNVSFIVDRRGSVLVHRGHVERAETLAKIPFPTYVFDNKVRYRLRRNYSYSLSRNPLLLPRRY
jgi:hypothetical protein